jgi:hypothetical protein
MNQNYNQIITTKLLQLQQAQAITKFQATSYKKNHYDELSKSSLQRAKTCCPNVSMNLLLNLMSLLLWPLIYNKQQTSWKT